VEKIRAATGWPLAVADNIDVIAPPSADELHVLRDLHERTRIAHAGSVLSSQIKSMSVTIANQVST
jgi:glutaconate CoA-transferase subunit B